MIKNGEVPSYKVFTNEPAKKRQRRLAKENREAKEAEELQNELGLNSGILSHITSVLTIYVQVLLATPQGFANFFVSPRMSQRC